MFLIYYIKNYFTHIIDILFIKHLNVDDNFLVLTITILMDLYFFSKLCIKLTLEYLVVQFYSLMDREDNSIQIVKTDLSDFDYTLENILFENNLLLLSTLTEIVGSFFSFLYTVHFTIKPKFRA